MPVSNRISGDPRADWVRVRAFKAPHRILRRQHIERASRTFTNGWQVGIPETGHLVFGSGRVFRDAGYSPSEIRRLIRFSAHSNCEVYSLKRGGMVVMEAAADYVGRNAMLKMFDALEIKRYEIVHEKADFYDRQEIDMVRLVAVKS